MQGVKRSFFSFRNGVVADTLRRSGSPFHIIFGLTLPQLAEVAQTSGPSAELAEALWTDRRTRESMLLAPMLMPAEAFTEAEALRWASESPCAEVADVLCHRLLRRLPYAEALVEALTADGRSDGERYVGARLALNLHALGKVDTAALERLANVDGAAGTIIRQYLSQL